MVKLRLDEKLILKSHADFITGMQRTARDLLLSCTYCMPAFGIRVGPGLQTTMNCAEQRKSDLKLLRKIKSAWGNAL